MVCQKRGKEIALKPEEAVRQLYLFKLFHEYGYPTSRIEVEFPILFGREVKRADIAIMDKDRPMVPYIVVELKKPKLSDGKEQLKSYCNATGAPIGVWTNGEQLSYYLWCVIRKHHGHICTRFLCNKVKVINFVAY